MDAIPPQGSNSVWDDHTVPAHDLLGDGATDLFAAALSAVGASVERTTPVQVAYQPGLSLRVVHDTVIRWPDGRRSTETMVGAAGRTPPEGAFTIGDGVHDVTVWRLPNDPWLPGLPAVMDPARIAPLLADLGLPAEDPERIRVTQRAYRPGRRAVLEVTGPGLRTFVKVVRPKKAAALRDRHEELADAVPAPTVLGWSPDHGVIVLQALPGRTLRDALFGGFGLPTPESVVQVLDDLPPVEVADAAAPDWRAAEFAGMISATVPALADRLDTLVTGLAPYERKAAAEPVVAVHGDYYEAQLLVDGGAITGLLDVDTFGPGRRVDDLATMIGHLSVLAVEAPQGERIRAYAERLVQRFDTLVEPALLRAAVGGVVLGLATGSFRVQDDGWQHHTERRVALAEEWLASADRLVVGDALSS